MAKPQGPSQTDPQPMPRGEWERLVADVTNQMRNYTKKYVTPMSKALSHDEGELVGTGNYVMFDTRRYMLTNEHVAREMQHNPLCHQFLNCNDVFRVTNPFHAFAHPIDVAITEIEDRVWNLAQHDSGTINEDQWALAHSPVDGELLFFKGYSGENSKFLFGNLFSSATSYCAQEIALPPDNRFNSRFHFGLDYRPDLAKSIDEKPRDLPDPHGFSGSLVWDTGYVAMSSRGETWSPEHAKLTGLVWAWPSSDACIVATRIEYVRSFLLRALP